MLEQIDCARHGQIPLRISARGHRARDSRERRQARSNLDLLLNDPIRSGVRTAAAERYGYPLDQITLRLYVGKFASPTTGSHEQRVRDSCASQAVGSGAIEVFGLADVVEKAREAAASKTYRDNPVLVTMKVLDAAGLLMGTDTSAA